MKILVIGHKGMLGHDLMSVLGAKHDVVGADVEDVDIRDTDSVLGCVEKHRPELVINSAAYTDVDGAESDADAAFAVNSQGAANVALVACETGARSIYYSTDYVFGGTKRDPFVEDDELNPIGVYARSKAEGERAVIDADPDAVILRTAWLYGLHGKNFVETMLKLAEDRDELRVVDDQVGSPTWSWHLAQATANIIEARAEGIYHLTNSGQVTWKGFAERIFEMAGKTVKVIPITTDELGRPAPRPAYSVLDGSRYMRLTGKKMPLWQEALKGYLEARNASKK